MISKKLVELLKAKGAKVKCTSSSVKIWTETPNGDEYTIHVPAKTDEELQEELFHLSISYNSQDEYKKITGHWCTQADEIWKDQLWKENFLDRVERIVRAFVCQQRQIKGSKYINKRDILAILNDNDIFVNDVYQNSKEEEEIRLSVFTSRTDWYDIRLILTKNSDFTSSFKDAYLKQPEFSAAELIFSYRYNSTSEAMSKLAKMADRKDELDLVADKLLKADFEKYQAIKKIA